MYSRLYTYTLTVEFNDMQFCNILTIYGRIGDLYYKQQNLLYVPSAAKVVLHG